MKISDRAMYPRGSVSARVISESVHLLGGPRALLMQLAHPKVAAGVDQHSDFEGDPFGRLARTLDAMTTIAFGTPDAAEAVLARLRSIHDGVTGETHAGEAYEANDPALLLWVHATLVDTVLEVERRYLGYLSNAERAGYYLESRQLARAFGVPDGMIPDDLDDFEGYIEDQCRTLEVSDTARRLSRSVLNPRVPLVPSPAWEPIRLVTIDLLPRPLREGYALPWDRHRKRLLRSAQAAVRLFLPRIPRPLRSLPTSARRTYARAG